MFELKFSLTSIVQTNSRLIGFGWPEVNWDWACWTSYLLLDTCKKFNFNFILSAKDQLFFNFITFLSVLRMSLIGISVFRILVSWIKGICTFLIFFIFLDSLYKCALIFIQLFVIFWAAFGLEGWQMLWQMLWQILLKLSVKFTKWTFFIVSFWSCSQISVIFIRSSSFSQVNNSRHILDLIFLVKLIC